MPKTATSAKNMFGDAPYQVRARLALPLLIRQANSRKPVYYEHLAAELGLKNPRNMNWVLGSVGVTLEELSARHDWDEPIPAIQSLVINQHQRLPGHGFDGFLAARVGHYESLSNAQKRVYLDGYWQDVFAYPYWGEVLAECGLAAAASAPASARIIDQAKRGKSGGGGEGDEHRELKEYISRNPAEVGLTATFPHGTMEAPLPSGDKIDVLFSGRQTMLAVEVKSRISNKVDLARGLFQCVKYRAVMLAERGYMG